MSFITGASGFGIGISAQTNGSGLFSKGVDLRVTIIDAAGQLVDLGGAVMSFKAVPHYDELAVKPISGGGEPDYNDEPDGWSGTIMIARYTGALDRRMAATEALYHDSGDFTKYTITQTIRNKAENRIDKFQFTRSTLRVDDPGEYKKGSTVDTTVTFRASRRLAL